MLKVQSVALDFADRRRSYYDLAEPLVRIAFQQTDSRGGPLRLVVEFLRNWFDPGETQGINQVDLVGYVDAVAETFLNDAVGRVTRELHGLPSTGAPALALREAVDSALANISQGDPEAFLGLPTQLRRAVEDRLSTGAELNSEIARLRLEVHRAARTEVRLLCRRSRPVVGYRQLSISNAKERRCGRSRILRSGTHRTSDSRRRN